MHTVSIRRLGEKTSPFSNGFTIQKDDDISFVCVIQTKHRPLTDSLYRLCTDNLMDVEPNRGNAVNVFTEVLETINQDLDRVYHKYKKSDVSLFVGLVIGTHIHFSTFGTDISGIIVSENSIEDILVDMDTGEGHFVYDSHGEIKNNECLYIFAPQIDTHHIGNECKNINHLSGEERCDLLAERIERTFIDDAVIICINHKSHEPEKKTVPGHLAKRQPNHKKVLANVKKIGQNSVSKIQAEFVGMSKNAQNWVLVSGLVVSIVLLYFIITTVMQSQYTLFVPQKYRDMLAQAQVSLDDASRTIDQPDQFAPAINKVREIIQEVKEAGVLKVDVVDLENQVAVLERAINKVTTLKPEEIKSIYTFTKNVDSVPFAIYAQDRKLSFVTREGIFGPFIPGETAKEFPLPNGEKFLFSDSDENGKIYFGTDQDHIYTFEKGVYNIQNILQVGGWDKARDISVYNGNIYLLSTENKQVMKYRKQSENTYAGRSFVITDTQTKPIVDIDIDGSVWLLSGLDKLSTEKILTAPRYERRGIPMNNIGINVFQNIDLDTTRIYAGSEYQEIYILADNRIWVFVPSSKRFTDVRGLSYVGQIDVPNTIITDIAIEQDGDIRNIYFGSPKSGVFVTKMTITEGKIHIYPAQ